MIRDIGVDRFLSRCLAIVVSLLGIAPLFFTELTRGPSLSEGHAYVCVGLLGGLYIGGLAKRRGTLPNRAACAMVVLATVAAGAMYVPQCACLGDWFQAMLEGKEYSIEIQLRWVRVAQNPVLLLSSLAMGFAAGNISKPIRRQAGGLAKVSVAVPFLLGYGARAVWLAAASLAQTPFGLAAADAASAICACSALVLVLYVLAPVMYLRASGDYGGSVSYICSYSCGLLLWALLTRIVPVFENLTLAVLVGVLASVLLGAGEVLLAADTPCDWLRAKESGRTKQEEVLEGKGLSLRELQIACGVLEGKTPRQVAEELGLADSTVRVTLSNVYKKLNVSGIAELRDLSKENDVAKGSEIKEPKAVGLRGWLLCALALAPLLPVMATGSAWGRGQALVLGSAYVLLLHGMRAAFFGRGAVHVRKPVKLGLLATLAVGLLLSGYFFDAHGQARRSAALAQCCVGAAYVAVLSCKDDFSGREGKDAEGKGQACLLALPYCASLGFVWEEAWRSTTSFSMAEWLVPLCWAIVAFSVKPLRQKKGEAALLAAVLAGLLALHVFGNMPLWPFLSIVLVPGARVVVKYLECDDGSEGGLCACAAAFGALGGVFLVNRMEDYLVYNDYFTKAFGGKGEFELYAHCAVVLVACAGACAAFVVGRCINDRVELTLEPTSEERLRGYLVSEGLNAIEVNAVMLIIGNKTTSQIAAELQYSTGAINTARRNAYAKLGVKSKDELCDLFEQVNRA